MAEITRRIAASRGYMAIRIRERGNVPRRMKKAFNASSKESWEDTAKYFHANLRDKRFTPEHARKAGYTARRGERMSRSQRGFNRTYYGRKLRSRFGGGRGRANPLEWTGRTRRNVRFARISSTSKGGKASYSGARVFNLRNANSRVNMAAEFRRITDDEITELADVYDRHLDQHLAETDR